MFSPESEIFLWIKPKKKKNFFGESLYQCRRLEVREKARNVFLWWAYVCLTTTSHLHRVFFDFARIFSFFFARISNFKFLGFKEFNKYAPRWLFTISYPTRAHGIIAGEQERDRRLILLLVVSGTFLKRTALEPTWRKILAHSWHSFVLATGMNGMWTNGGAKALVLSSSSVTWVMFFTWILACHGQRLLVQAIKLSFHLKSVFSMALYPRQNSRFAFDVQVYHLTMRHLSLII